MSYQIELSGPAQPQLASDRLPIAVIEAALAFIDSALREQPRVVGKPLRGQLDGTWSARRGAYRVLYRIDDEKRLVTIIDIAHRADVYRPR